MQKSSTEVETSTSSSAEKKPVKSAKTVSIVFGVFAMILILVILYVVYRKIKQKLNKSTSTHKVTPPGTGATSVDVVKFVNDLVSGRKETQELAILILSTYQGCKQRVTVHDPHIAEVEDEKNRIRM